MVQFKLKNYAEAEKEFTRIIEIYPVWEGYFHRGKVRLAEKKFEEALLDFNKTIELESRVAEVYFERAIVKKKLKDKKGAKIDRAKGEELKTAETDK